MSLQGGGAGASHLIVENEHHVESSSARPLRNSEAAPGSDSGANTPQRRDSAAGTPEKPATAPAVAAAQPPPPPKHDLFDDLLGDQEPQEDLALPDLPPAKAPTVAVPAAAAASAAAPSTLAASTPSSAISQRAHSESFDNFDDDEFGGFNSSAVPPAASGACAFARCFI